MTLTQAQIEKYQKIYREQFGRDISYEEALKQGIALVDLVRLVVSDTNTSLTPPYHSITSNSRTTI